VRGGRGRNSQGVAVIVEGKVGRYPARSTAAVRESGRGQGRPDTGHPGGRRLVMWDGRRTSRFDGNAPTAWRDAAAGDGEAGRSGALKQGVTARLGQHGGAANSW